jgi:membrane associated rhomboid family serine protease
MIDFAKDRVKSILLAYVLIFIPMWTIYFMNHGVLNNMFLNILGVHPRTFEFMEFFGIMGSWMVHDNNNAGHILNNSIGLIGLLFFVGLFEKRIVSLLTVLIATSGISTWVLGAPNSVHIGASGLLFALFGYILSSAFLGKRWIYLIPIVGAVAYYGLSYYGSFLNGLKLQDGVSFAAHFGGLLSGCLTGWLYNKEEEKTSYKRSKSIKEKWNDFVWSLKYKFKK